MSSGRNGNEPVARRSDDRRANERRTDEQPIVLQWSEKLITGVQAIDDDHRALFEEFRILQEQFSTSGDKGIISGAINGLTLYVDEHFEREEMFMERASYPDLEAHKQTHRLAARQIHELKRLFLEDPDSVDGTKVVSFLSRWLSGHILGADMQYVPYLRNNAGGSHVANSPPEELYSVEVALPKDEAETIQKLADILRNGGRPSKYLMETIDQVAGRYEEKIQVTAVKLFCKDV